MSTEREPQKNVEDLPARVEELTEGDAEQARGGIALLLPAVQKVREASVATGDVNNDGLLLPYIEQDNLYK